MINIQKVTLQRGRKILLQDATANIFMREKIGLIGINGCGKSSLFALILQQLQPDTGTIEVPKELRIAHIQQEIPNSNIAAIDYVIQGNKEIAALYNQLQQAEQNHNHELQANLHDKIYQHHGYAIKTQAAEIMLGLGFTNDIHNKPVNEFSGGWRVRLNLAQTLIAPSDLLLLDEPTNHLDLDAILWLEAWLKKYSGTLILISHDREFLDNTITKILHITNQRIDTYGGNYEKFEKQRAVKLELEAKLATKQQKKIEHLNKFITRFRAKATKAKQAQSRVKMLEKLQQIAITQIESPFDFSFLPTTKCSPPLLQCDNLSFAYGSNKVLSKINFSINPEDRIGILGINGAGKTTFIKLLTQELQPDTGTIVLNNNLKIGYFAQHQIDQLDLSNSAFMHLTRLDKTLTEQTGRNFLGGFGFQDDRVFEPIKTFSGGEKARLALALLIWQKPNLLLLDEPTNHLDLDMRESLTYALQDYSGAIILVSHDRYLLKATVDDLYLIDKHHLNKFNGNLENYQAWLLEEINAAKPPKTKTTENSHLNKKQIRSIETKLNKLYQQKSELEAQLINPELYQNHNNQKLADLQNNLRNTQDKIDHLEEQWLEIN